MGADGTPPPKVLAMPEPPQNAARAHREGESYLQQGLETLRGSGRKVTEQRRAILELFDAKREHLTPNQIFEALEDRLPSLSLATVYNTLELFEQEGLVARVVARDGETYFDPNVDPHHHAVCAECGEILDMQVDPETLEALGRASEAMEHEELEFDVTSATVWFEGVCRECRAEQ
jgi:Fur family peroxide stress response transcriptional regulator